MSEWRSISRNSFVGLGIRATTVHTMRQTGKSILIKCVWLKDIGLWCHIASEPKYYTWWFHITAHCNNDTEMSLDLERMNYKNVCAGSLKFLLFYFQPVFNSSRKLLAFVLIPVLQGQLDTFRETVWNTHRIRTQKNTVLACGVPDHMYSFPEEYGLEECGK